MRCPLSVNTATTGIQRLFLQTIDQVKNFNERLDGRWHGSVTDIKCDVSPYADYDPLTIINSFDVDAEFEKHFRGALILQLQQENAEQVHLDTLFLTPNTEEFDLDTQGRKNQGQKVGQRNYSCETQGRFCESEILEMMLLMQHDWYRKLKLYQSVASQN